MGFAIKFCGKWGNKKRLGTEMTVVMKSQNNGRLSFLSSFSNLFCVFLLFLLSFFHLSVFCWVHALTIKVDEMLPKLSRNGEENHITDLQCDSQNPHFLFSVLNYSSVISQSRMWGLVGAPLLLESEFRVRIH